MGFVSDTPDEILICLRIPERSGGAMSLFFGAEQIQSLISLSSSFFHTL